MSLLNFKYYNLNSNDENFESLTVISVEHYCKANMFEMINSWKHTEFRKVIKK